MARFRVTQVFPLLGDPPTQAAALRLRGRLHEAAPGADPAVDVGIGRIQVALSFQAVDATVAVALATTAARAVFARSATRLTVEAADPSTRAGPSARH